MTAVVDRERTACALADPEDKAEVSRAVRVRRGTLGRMVRSIGGVVSQETKVGVLSFSGYPKPGQLRHTKGRCRVKKIWLGHTVCSAMLPMSGSSTVELADQLRANC